MIVDVVSLFPEIVSAALSHSIPQRAIDKGLAQLNLIQLRDYGQGNYRRVDDYPYGGGGGMVMACEPLGQCLDALLEKNSYDEVIYLSPDGARFNQPTANRLSLGKRLLLLCGHYKGIDQRIRDRYVTLEISIGDYVLSGGELAGAVVVDSLFRLLPGAMSDETSALTDSFQDGLLAPPVYTRPELWREMPVPSVLLSGHDAEISKWRHEQALERTRLRRPDMLD
jgi:tRNA (guanine37-N1)-methyltransferase